MTAEQLFNRTAAGFNARWGIVTALRRATEVGLPLTHRVIAAQDATFVDSLKTDPGLKVVITPALAAA